MPYGNVRQRVAAQLDRDIRLRRGGTWQEGTIRVRISTNIPGAQGMTAGRSAEADIQCVTEPDADVRRDDMFVVDGIVYTVISVQAASKSRMMTEQGYETVTARKMFFARMQQ